jgi:DNA repair ATPase RecN
MIKYKVLSKGENILDTVVRKTGGYNDISIKDLKNNIKTAEKTLKEVEATQTYYEAIMKNVENSDPEVKELSERLLAAAYIYRNAMGIVNEAVDKSKEIREAIEEDKKALEDIKSQCNLEIND